MYYTRNTLQNVCTSSLWIWNQIDLASGSLDVAKIAHSSDYVCLVVCLIFRSVKYFARQPNYVRCDLLHAGSLRWSYSINFTYYECACACSVFHSLSTSDTWKNKHRLILLPIVFFPAIMGSHGTPPEQCLYVDSSREIQDASLSTSVRIPPTCSQCTPVLFHTPSPSPSSPIP